MENAKSHVRHLRSNCYRVGVFLKQTMAMVFLKQPSRERGSWRLYMISLLL